MEEHFYAEAQKAAEAHLAAVQEAYYDFEAGQDTESPAIAPFDGCDTCIVREVLHAALPVIERGIRAELGDTLPDP